MCNFLKKKVGREGRKKSDDKIMNAVLKMSEPKCMLLLGFQDDGGDNGTKHYGEYEAEFKHLVRINTTYLFLFLFLFFSLYFFFFCF